MWTALGETLFPSKDDRIRACVALIRLLPTENPSSKAYQRTFRLSEKATSIIKIWLVSGRHSKISRGIVATSGMLLFRQCSQKQETVEGGLSTN